MPTRIIKLIVGIVAVVVIGGIAVLAVTSAKSPAAGGNMSPMSTMDRPVANRSDAKATDEVTIKGFAFNPQAITVKAGTTVTWTNQDSVRHNVVTDSGDGPDGPLLAKGESYRYTFKTAGTYTYHCAPHPSMTGTVFVTD